MHFLEDNEIENYVKNFFINNKENSILTSNTYKKAGMYFTDEQNKFYYEENFINPSDNNKEINIIHLVLANYENEKLYEKYITSIDFIEVIIKDCSKSAETFKIKDKLLEFLKENKKFYNFEINNNNEIIYKEKNNKINKISDIHLNEKFSPNFCYYIDKERNKFIIEIETIFNPPDFKINNEKKSGSPGSPGVEILTIKFKKEINNENDKELCNVVPQDYDIQLGDCELKLIIPLDKVQFDSSSEKRKCFFENGKIQIEYELTDNKDDSSDSVVKLNEESEEESESNNDKEDDEKEDKSDNEDDKKEKVKLDDEDDSNKEDDEKEDKSDEYEKEKVKLDDEDDSNKEDDEKKNKSDNEDDEKEKVKLDDEDDSNNGEENNESGNSD
jgi:hypothetical protein